MFKLEINIFVWCQVNILSLEHKKDVQIKLRGILKKRSVISKPQRKSVNIETWKNKRKNSKFDGAVQPYDNVSNSSLESKVHKIKVCLTRMQHKLNIIRFISTCAIYNTKHSQSEEGQRWYRVQTPRPNFAS